MAQGVARQHLEIAVRKDRPIRSRADEAHVAERNIEHLWEFVYVRSPQQPSEWRDTCIAGCCGHCTGVTLRILDHRAQLELVETPAAARDRDLDDQEWPGV